MNHRSSGSLSLSKAIEGFLSFKSAEGLSGRSVDSYNRLLQKWLEHMGDKEISKVKAADLTGYLSWLRTDYIPHLVALPDRESSQLFDSGTPNGFGRCRL